MVKILYNNLYMCLLCTFYTETNTETIVLKTIIISERSSFLFITMNWLSEKKQIKKNGNGKGKLFFQ